MWSHSARACGLQLKSKKIIIVVDYHDSYRGDGDDSVKELSGILSKKYEKDIRCFTAGRSTQPYFDQLQTQDIVTYSVFDRFENGKPTTSIIMGQKVKRLSKKDNIMREKTRTE